jgi:thiamine biosynthesis lipoprotein
VIRTLRLPAVLTILAVAAVLALLMLRSRAPGGYEAVTREVMASHFTVLLPAKHLNAAEEVFEIFRDVDARMNEWRPDSPLSEVNAAAGKEPVYVDDDLRALLRRGLEIGALTDGAFDVTWAALWGLWDFKAETPRLPDVAEVASRAARVDYRRVRIDNTAGTVHLLQPGAMLGLGGIAKGYALDLAARALREAGVESFLISGGGQMMAAGMRDGRPWRIGIRDPRGATDDYFAYVDVVDASTSTSGDYESFFVVDGVRYHHILDPRTGMPARPPDPLRSATVVSADATLADALSTALIVLGKSRALDLVEELAGVEAVLVDADARVHVSSGLRGKLHERHSPAP